MTTYCGSNHYTKAFVFVQACVSALCVAALAAGCGKNTAAPAGRRVYFEGNWKGILVQDPTRKYFLRLTFSGDAKMTADSRIILAKEGAPGGEQEYPGTVCDYEYEASETAANEGTLAATMTSKRIEGGEQIAKEDKAPQSWRFRVKSGDVLEIAKPSGAETKTFVLQREK